MLNYQEFTVLRLLAENGCASIEEFTRAFKMLSYNCGITEEELLETVQRLQSRGDVLNGWRLTENARYDMEACQVKNAIILAAGGTEMTSKNVLSLPKGLFKINGTTLIERQISQLQEVGIKDITVVIGYKKELYFYLEDKCGVKLAVNPYPRKNNIYSLFTVAHELNNTYICNCDNYYPENPFHRYEYRPFHGSVDKEDISQELAVTTNNEGRITRVFTSSGSGMCVFGHAYFDRQFSEKMRRYMNAEIENFRIDTLFWEEFFARHIQELDMYTLKFKPNAVREFDYIQELQSLDSLFIENVSEDITSIICEVLVCEKTDIRDVHISSKGLTNLLFTFEAKGGKYIFRYPGGSSSNIIYRVNEMRAQEIAAQAGIDTTCLYIDERGHKLSKLVEGLQDVQKVYYKDIEFMRALSKKIRRLHDAGRDIPDAMKYALDPLEEADRLMRQAMVTKGDLFKLFEEMRSQVKELMEYTEQDGIPKTMCHNDINGDNCLLSESGFDIIDWEFAGYNDPGFDFGRVIAEYECDSREIDEILEAYFDRPATSLERLHWVAYVAIHNWYYVCWALYKESINEDTREWMLFFYEKVKKVLAYALPRYRKIYHQ